MSTVPDEAPTAVETHRKPPFLRRVRIRNFKSIKFCDVTLEPLTVLVGRNGSGKSNFVEALAFLRDIMATNVSEAARRRGGWLALRYQTARDEEMSFELEVASQVGDRNTGQDACDPFSATYGFTLREGPSGSPIRLHEHLQQTDGSDATLGDQSFSLAGSYDPDTYDVGYRWTGPCQPSPIPHPHPDHMWLASRGFSLSKELRRIGCYNFSPQEIRQPQKQDVGQFLEDDGRNLANLVSRMRGGNSDVFDRVRDYLSIVVDAVEGITPVDLGGYQTIRFNCRGGKPNEPLVFAAAAMSDGTLRVLAALMAGFQSTSSGEYPSLVAIEEPETSLHPAAMHALVDALDEATGRTQILLTTHSTELLDNPTIQPENVRVVEMVNGETIITPLDEASVEIVKQQLDTLGGLERQNQLALNDDDRERQQKLAAGSESK